MGPFQEMERLDCVVQKYAWGKTGEDSAVARAKRSGGAERFEVVAGDPYAELWMGTHPNGPSKMFSSGRLLYDWLQDQQASGGAIGQVPEGYPENDIPFMFKVLSIQTALSIQAHPDKTFAPILHATQPDIYKDPNHKPEMCVALTPMEALKGFRPCSEIAKFMGRFPALRDIIGEEASTLFLQLKDDAQNESEALSILFGAFLRCSPERASLCVKALIETLSSEASLKRREGDEEEEYLCDLIMRLHNDYPGDPGVFCPFILNCLQLSPGQAFFMQANEPHAYVKGDIVEVMALSDNVVRAGLTPKFKDVETMCKMLDYRSIHDPSLCLVPPLRKDPHCILYRPPPEACREFEVEMITLPADGSAGEYSLTPAPCASILLFVQAAIGASFRAGGNDHAEPLCDGAVYFLAAKTSVTLSFAPTTSSSSSTSPDSRTKTDLVVFRAHINLGE